MLHNKHIIKIDSPKKLKKYFKKSCLDDVFVEIIQQKQHIPIKEDFIKQKVKPRSIFKPNITDLMNKKPAIINFVIAIALFLIFFTVADFPFMGMVTKSVNINSGGSNLVYIFPLLGIFLLALLSVSFILNKKEVKNDKGKKSG